MPKDPLFYDEYPDPDGDDAYVGDYSDWHPDETEEEFWDHED